MEISLAPPSAPSQPNTISSFDASGHAFHRLRDRKNSLFFAGSFLTSFATNATALNNTNNPNIPYSPGAMPFSSSLVPVPLEGAQILGQPSSSNPQFSNIPNILCPAGPDGPGNTWLAANGNGAVITVHDFSSINAYGVHLGNTSQSGFGTTTSRQCSTDFVICQPINGTKHDTHKHLSSVDRLINLIPGLHFHCSGDVDWYTDHSVWTGEAPGLHMLQLLSSGAFASSNGNMKSCFSHNPSNTTSTDQWTTKDAVTNIPATPNRPSFHSSCWHIPLSGSQFYLAADCPLHTSVQVTVFPGGGSQPWVSTEALNSSAAGVPADGLATWNISTSLWVNSGGFVVGNMTFIGNGTLPASGQEQTQFVASNVCTMAEYGSSGLVMLSSGGSTGPLVTPMGVQLTSSVANVSSLATITKRHPHIHRGPSAWISHLNIGTLFTPQSANSSALPPAPAPAVLAGAFWTNVSTSHQVAIIGGNF
ncbi:hypothetical protein F4604DRAFT_1980010 [Suillus subluteus]|nr:hypothetical protein F4604DRAFT_1980010 [Suillus subluteus]